MAVHLDAPRYLKCSASCCEILLHAKSYSPETALGILAYMKEKSDYGITLQRGSMVSVVSLEVFADADYASEATDRHSVYGGVVMCGGGVCVCWFSSTKQCVTLLTTHRGKVYGCWGRSEGVTVFETGVAFHVA